MAFKVVGRFTFLLFCCFLVLFSQNVTAQTEQIQQNLQIESSAEILESEPEIEKTDNEVSTNQQDASENTETIKKNISGEQLEDSEENKEPLNITPHTKINRFNFDFDSIEELKDPIDSQEKTEDEKRFSFPVSPSDSFDDPLKTSPKDDFKTIESEGFRWGPAVRQSLIFLAVQHGYALTQPKTREALKGNFFKDYAKSVKSLRGWDDGGRFFTNYIAHPMQGAMTGFIYVQNDPKAINQQFGKSGAYWRSRMKAMAWSAAWSTQFEIGPLSQASIGNVGLSGKQTWEDIVITPTLGTAMLIAEDAADRFIMQSIERETDNFYVRIFLRMLLSPTRLFANMLRFKTPWYRDRSRNF